MASGEVITSGIAVEAGRFGWDYVIYSVANEDQTILVQSDWEYPGLARAMGWIPCKKCGRTDGTIDCAHRTASEMIAEAQEWIDSRLGEVFEDPGYFGGED